MKKLAATAHEIHGRTKWVLVVVVFLTLMRITSQNGPLLTYLDLTTRRLSMTFNSVDSASSPPFRKWAYVYLIGGCQQQNPNYRGFLYNVMASKYSLQKLGSQADVVVMIQMSVHTNETKLPDHEEELLSALNIKFRYLPKYATPENENFYSLMLEKFRILELTEYSRAMYLDGDVLPECSLDYLFDLSEPETGEPLLKENVLIGYKIEPSHGGLFMYRPDMGDYEWLQRVIQTKEEKALNLPFPHWDEVEGWGHKIEVPDFWRSPWGRKGTNWTWHGSFADQGLLYHWSKYEKQLVSLIIGGEIENWSSRNGSAFLEEVIRNNPLSNYTCPNKTKFGSPPISDFQHFTGSRKPWEPGNYRKYKGYLDRVANEGTKDAEGANSYPVRWYRVLESIAASYNAKFDFSHLEVDKPGHPTVGRYPLCEQMISHIRTKARRNWNSYEEDEDKPNVTASA